MRNYKNQQVLKVVVIFLFFLSIPWNKGLIMMCLFERWKGIIKLFYQTYGGGKKGLSCYIYFVDDGLMEFNLWIYIWISPLPPQIISLHWPLSNPWCGCPQSRHSPCLQWGTLIDFVWFIVFEGWQHPQFHSWCNRKSGKEKFVFVLCVGKWSGGKMASFQ